MHNGGKTKKNKKQKKVKRKEKRFNSLFDIWHSELGSVIDLTLYRGVDFAKAEIKV